MSLERMCNDKFTLLKVNGEKFSDVKGLVSTNTIMIPTSKVLIESNDLLIRQMSNGGQDTYEVLDPNFHENMGSR